jgi:hypothetical protein
VPSLTVAGRAYVVIATVWAIGVVAHAVAYVRFVIKLEPGPDTYANGAGFQLIVFAITRLPIWIVALAIAMLVAKMIIRPR